MTSEHRPWKFTALFVCLLAAVVLRPFLLDAGSGGGAGRWVFAVLMTVFFVAAIRSLSEQTWQRRTALVLGGLCIALRWAVQFEGPENFVYVRSAGHVSEIVFFGFVVAMLLAAIFRKRTVTVDKILGAFAGYLLIAFIFGIIFSLLELTSPGSFRVHEQLQGEWQDPGHREWLMGYFSCCTLMTIGYGDITPVHPAARTLAILEGMTGQLYLAVLVAVLVGVRVAQSTLPKND